MKLTERQLSAYVRYATILRNIQKRCLVQGIDIHAEETPALLRKNTQSKLTTKSL